jgi:hypothetical protein
MRAAVQGAVGMNLIRRSLRLADVGEDVRRIEERLVRGDMRVDDGPHEGAIARWRDPHDRPGPPGVAFKRRVAPRSKRGSGARPNSCGEERGAERVAVVLPAGRAAHGSRPIADFRLCQHSLPAPRVFQEAKP